MGITRYTGQATGIPDAAAQEALLGAVVPRLAESLAQEEGQDVAELAGRLLEQEARRRGLLLSAEAARALVRQAVSRVQGLGFLDEVLGRYPEGLEEIAVNPNGTVWVMRRGATRWERVSLTPPPTPDDVYVVVRRLLARVGRSVTEAEPLVAAKIPPDERLPAGARLQVNIPPVVHRGEYPSVNIRFYHQRPVHMADLVQWGMLPREMADELVAAVRRRLRFIIAGGTRTGKTTFLSALMNDGLDLESTRVVLVEDTGEIFLEGMAGGNIVAMETRPGSVDGRFAVRQGHLVTVALRMSPEWLIVGEVRTWHAGGWLLRAQTSDHAGMSTVHADSPRAAVRMFELLARLEGNVDDARAVRELFAMAVDVVVQVGFDRHGVRRVLEVVEVQPELEDGEVVFRPIWRYRSDSPRNAPAWEKVGEFTRVRT